MSINKEIIEYKKWHKYIYYYIRYSLMTFIILFSVAIPYNFIITSSQPEYIEYLFIGILIIVFPAFMILPGIIYEGEFKTAWHGFTLDKFRYDLFLGLTLGIGPTILFFWKYDTLLKDYFKKHSDNIKNKS